MRRMIQRIFRAFFPPVTARKALRLAADHAGVPETDLNQWIVRAETPKLYNPPAEPCWPVYCPWNDGKPPMIRSSRVILVSKLTGKILYDGSASDEG